MIKDFDVSCFKPVSYELRLESVSELDGKGEVPSSRNVKLPYVLKPGKYVLGTTFESLKMPASLMAVLVPTSFAIRIGVGINCGKIDPTYLGKVYFGIYNLSDREISLKSRMRLVHLLVSEFKGETIPLETKYFGVELK
ncbi:MAG: hypothetical protein V1722_05275 [Candidatus Micrarchaeota archaeon]